MKRRLKILKQRRLVHKGCRAAAQTEISIKIKPSIGIKVFVRRYLNSLKDYELNHFKFNTRDGKRKSRGLCPAQTLRDASEQLCRVAGRHCQLGRGQRGFKEEIHISLPFLTFQTLEF
jgi:hypothetical protein